jgi:outer membrane protein assembly factor BamB
LARLFSLCCARGRRPWAQSPPFVAAVRDGGIITALNPSTGTLLKEGRTREALGGYYASSVATDGKVLLSSSEGKITVLKAGAQWEILSANDMQEEIHATPPLSEGRIYIRTRDPFYCFGPKF